VRVLGTFLLFGGVLLLGFRLVERFAGGFVGEICIAGLTIIPFHMPIFLAGLLAFACGAALLFTQSRRPTKDAGPGQSEGTSNSR